METQFMILQLQQKLDQFKEERDNHAEAVAFHLEARRRAESSIVQLERVIQDLEFRENTSERQDRKPDQLKKIEFVGQYFWQSIFLREFLFSQPLGSW
jgi:hypothetical protein